MNKNLRVLVLSDLYPNNINPVKGMFVHNQLKRLSDRGVGIIVVSPVAWSSRLLSLIRKKWGDYLKIDRKAKIDGIEVEYPRYFRPSGLWFYPYSGITCYLGIKKIIENIYREFPFDIIYTNALIPSGYAGCLLASKIGLPSLCCIGESDLGYLSFNNSSLKRIKNVILNTTRLISVSKYERERILDIARPEKPVEVIYRGTDTDKFKPSKINLELKRKLLLPDDSQVVTFVGHLIRRKGVHDLLNAFRLVVDKQPKSYLLIMGDGPERSNLELLSNSIGIKKRVIFAGLVKNEEIPSYFSFTDVMAFPSYAEGLPNAVVEAIACGKAVVATDAGGIPEVIFSGINGFLSSVGDIKALSLNIIKLLSDKILRERMGQEARKIAEAHFDAKKNVGRVIDLFEQVIQEYSAAIKACSSK